MRRTIIGGALVAAGAVTFTTAAHAQGTTIVAQPPAPSTAVQAAPPEETVVHGPGPNRVLLGTGLGLFGAAYIPSVVVAGTSNRSEDQRLYIPVAGPWLDLAQRPGCGGGPVASCNFETGNKVLLSVDGVAQGLGALATVVSFFVPQNETVATTTAAASSPFKPTLHVAPAEMGAAGAGVRAFGTW